MFLIIILILVFVCLNACFFYYKILEIEKDINNIYDLVYSLEKYNYKKELKKNVTNVS